MEDSSEKAITPAQGSGKSWKMIYFLAGNRPEAGVFMTLFFRQGDHFWAELRQKNVEFDIVLRSSIPGTAYLTSG